MGATVAIVGRPNVGKSTLFNRLVGKRLALVDDTPGVTRDRRPGDARLGDLRFTIIDTAGLEEADRSSLEGRMRRQTEEAIDTADAVLFLIDARAGVTPLDAHFADVARKTTRPVILLANKAEGRAGESGLYESYSLGLGEPIAISAEHGEGLADLYDALKPHVDRVSEEEEARREEAVTNVDVNEDGELIDEEDPVGTAERPLRVAIVGRPNAGKSTLINKMVGEDRMLTGPEAGSTRDSISVSTDWGGRAFRIFDTAGMRKKARVQEKLEKLSVSDGLRATKFAEVVVVMIDVQSPFDQQVLRIADLAEREGRAVVVAVNKWDIEQEKQEKLRDLKEAFARLLPQLRGAPLITVSAKTGRGLDRLRAADEEAYRVWNPRVSTARLNRGLQGM